MNRLARRFLWLTLLSPAAFAQNPSTDDFRSLDVDASQIIGEIHSFQGLNGPPDPGNPLTSRSRLEVTPKLFPTMAVPTSRVSWITVLPISCPSTFARGTLTLMVLPIHMVLFVSQSKSAASWIRTDSQRRKAFSRNGI